MSRRSAIPGKQAAAQRTITAQHLRTYLGAAADEDSVHRSVVDHLHMRARGDVFWAHVPNGGDRHPAVGAKLKAMGTRKGFPDLLFIIGGRAHLLELKRVGGKPDPEQRRVMAQLEAAGAVVAVAAGVDAAVSQLVAWGVFK